MLASSRGTLRRRKVCGRAMALPYNRGKRPTIRHPAISAAPRIYPRNPSIFSEAPAGRRSTTSKLLTLNSKL